MERKPVCSIGSGDPFLEPVEYVKPESKSSKNVERKADEVARAEESKDVDLGK